jgi:5-methylcytosine-specific restriction endonuclease McrA
VLHADHVVPVAAGGETTEVNLVTACETCNLGKGVDLVRPPQQT